MTNDRSQGKAWSNLTAKEKMTQAIECPRSQPEEVVVDLCDVIAAVKNRILKGDGSKAWPRTSPNTNGTNAADRKIKPNHGGSIATPQPPQMVPPQWPTGKQSQPIKVCNRE